MSAVGGTTGISPETTTSPLSLLPLTPNLIFSHRLLRSVLVLRFPPVASCIAFPEIHQIRPMPCDSINLVFHPPFGYAKFIFIVVRPRSVPRKSSRLTNSVPTASRKLVCKAMETLAPLNRAAKWDNVRQYFQFLVL